MTLYSKRLTDNKLSQTINLFNDWKCCVLYSKFTNISCDQPLQKRRRDHFFLFFIGLIAGLAYFIVPWVSPFIDPLQLSAVLIWRFCFGLLTTIMILRSIVLSKLKIPQPSLIILIAGATSGLIATFAMYEWPNSADEYGYNYLADTLSHLRLWNKPLPDFDLFQTYYIAQRDGKLFSQYPPGWPVLLVFFDVLHIGFLGNAVLTTVFGFVLTLSLRVINVAAPVINALLIIILFSPFVLFNGASYFSHTASALLVLLICWLQLSDEIYQSFRKKLALGFCFSFLLTTRYEVFFVLVCLYILDQILRWSDRTISQLLYICVGAMPFTLCFFIYNWQITGNPFLPVETWAGTGGGIGLYAHGIDGFNSPIKALFRLVLWTSNLCDFSSSLLLVAYCVALSARIIRRTARFFDFIFPGIVLFFIFYPDFGGFQYGPRYWFVAFPPMALTIAAAMNEAAPSALSNYARKNIERIAKAQMIVYLGFTIAYAIFLHREFEIRRSVLLDRPPVLPALILIPDFNLRLSPVQWGKLTSSSLDFTRNGVDFTGQVFRLVPPNQRLGGFPVLYGRDLPWRFTKACSLEKPIFVWNGPSNWVQLKCPT